MRLLLVYKSDKSASANKTSFDALFDKLVNVIDGMHAA